MRMPHIHMFENGLIQNHMCVVLDPSQIILNSAALVCGILTNVGWDAHAKVAHAKVHLL